PRAVNSCPCGAGEEPCPGPDGKPLCSGARSSVGSEQRTSNPQGAGSNPAERTNCPKCGRETCGCTFSAHSLWDQIAEIYDGLDAEDCAMVDREWAKQRGYILPTDGTSTVTSTDGRTPIIEPIESVGMRGANKQAHTEHASMFPSTERETL